MPELTREEKLKIFEKLPKELQNLMQSEDTGAFLLYLGEKYNLDYEKTSSLSKIVGDVILGIIPAISLAQEINLKITPDTQTAMGLAQELYTNLLATVTVPPKPVPQPMIPQTQMAPVPIPTPKTDQYREPTAGGPEIIDLRKTPPPPIQMPVAAAPIPPKPLTFTRPIEPKMIEAEPHKIMPAPPAIKADTYREPVEQPSVSINNPPAMDVKPKEPLPQYIIRPPGLPPTDFPRDVLDLRKDKGEF